MHCARVGVLFEPTPFTVFKREHCTHCEVPRVTVNRVRSRNNSILYYDGLGYIEGRLLTIINNIILGTLPAQTYYLRVKIADFRKPLSTGCVTIYIYIFTRYKLKRLDLDAARDKKVKHLDCRQQLCCASAD